jgi:hypothetical protein
MTAEINKAICAVMAGIKRLEKAGNNAFGKYKYTSADDFKDHVRPLMAEHGLSVSISETGLETLAVVNKQEKETTSVKIGFELTLRHSDGSELPPEKASVILPYVGAQTAGIAKSYILKEWIKGRFLASSGDQSEDGDGLNYEIPGTVLTKAEARPVFEALIKELREIVATDRSSEALLAWASDNRALYMSLPLGSRNEVKKEYEDELASILAQEKADGKR